MRQQTGMAPAKLKLKQLNDNPLIRHLVSHFASANITLRQVLDWAFFVKVHTKEIDWQWFVGLLEKYHMKDFYNYLNAICVENLGFGVNIFPQVQFEPNIRAGAE